MMTYVPLELSNVATIRCLALPLRVSAGLLTSRKLGSLMIVCVTVIPRCRLLDRPTLCLSITVLKLMIGLTTFLPTLVILYVSMTLLLASYGWRSATPLCKALPNIADLRRIHVSSLVPYWSLVLQTWYLLLPTAITL